MKPNSPFRLLKIRLVHRLRMFLQPSLLFAKTSHEVLIPRHNQCVGLEIKTIASLGVVRAANQADTRILLTR